MSVRTYKNSPEVRAFMANNQRIARARRKERLAKVEGSQATHISQASTPATSDSNSEALLL